MTIVPQLHKRVQDVVDQAVQWGYTWDGTFSGGTHPRLFWTDGSWVDLPLTPSSKNFEKYALAHLRRVASIKNDGPKHRKSRKGNQGSGFSMHAAVTGRRDDLSGTFTVGAPESPTREPLELTRLRAEETRLTAEWATNPSGAVEVQLRNIRTRIEQGIY